MSVYDTNIQSECFTRFTYPYSSSHCQTLLNVSIKPYNDRTAQESELLADLLHNISKVNQTFNISPDYRTYLLQCADYLEHSCFKRGDPLILRGDKCNEVFIILEGAVNIYDLKTPQEIQKQICESQEAANRQNLKNKYKSLNPSVTLNKNVSQKTVNSTTRRRPNETVTPSIEIASEQEKTTNTNVFGKKSTFNNKRKLKVKLMVAMLSSKEESLGDGNDEKEGKPDEPYFDYLPECEQILLENELCRSKYFKDGACLLGLKDTIGMGDIINEKCLLAEYRCPVTLVAEDDVECLKLSRQAFRSVVGEEIKSIEEKKQFFLHFFHEAPESVVLAMIEHTVEKKYKMHETIYNQGDKSQGIYFVKTKGEVKFYLTKYEKKEEKEGETENLFLPEKQRTQKKSTSVVGIISEGDFFGEEGIIFGQSVRKYTAISAAERLIIYYIAPSHLSRIFDKCPKVFNILKKRGSLRNNWMDNNIKTCEAIKEKAKELFQVHKSRPQTGISSQRKWNTSEVMKSQNATRNHHQTTSFNQVLIVNDKDVPEFLEGNLPYYFTIARENTESESNSDPNANIVNIKGTKENLPSEITQNQTKAKENDHRKVGLKTFRKITKVQSIDIPITNKLFEHERSRKRRILPKSPEPINKGTSITMTGMRKDDENFQKAFQNRLLKQVQLSQNSPRELKTTNFQSATVYGFGTQYGVKNCVSPQVVSTLQSSRTISPSSYNFSKITSEIRSPKIVHSTKPITNFKKTLQSAFESSRTDNGRKKYCLNIDTSLHKLSGRTLSESQVSKGLPSYRSANNICEKNNLENGSSVIDTARKSSISAMKTIKQLSRPFSGISGDRIETEPTPSTIVIDETSEKSSYTTFKRKITKKQD